MKRILSVLCLIGLLSVYTTSMLSASLVSTDPDQTLTYESSLYPEICWCMLDGTQEILGVTSDGCYVIRYKGKIYIVQPKAVN